MKRFINFPVILALVLWMPSCIIINEDDGFCPQANGSYVTEEIAFPPLRGFELNMAAEVYYTYGPEQRVTVEARTDVLDVLSTEVRNGIWDIELDRCLQYNNVEVYITTPFVDHIELAGSGLIRSTNVIETNQDLELRLSGSGEIDLALEIDELDLDLSGSGDCILEGIGDEADVYTSGSGDVDAFAFELLDVNVEISGSGDVRTTVLENLWVRITGSGDVYYRGMPDITVDITGSGDLIDAN